MNEGAALLLGNPGTLYETEGGAETGAGTGAGTGAWTLALLCWAMFLRVARVSAMLAGSAGIAGVAAEGTDWLLLIDAVRFGGGLPGGVVLSSVVQKSVRTMDFHK